MCSFKTVSKWRRCSLEPHFKHACTTRDPMSLEQYSASVSERCFNNSKISPTTRLLLRSLELLMSSLYSFVTSFRRCFFALSGFFPFFPACSSPPSAPLALRFRPRFLLAASGSAVVAALPAPLPTPFPLPPLPRPGFTPPFFFWPAFFPLPAPLLPPAALLLFLSFFFIGRPLPASPAALPAPGRRAAFLAIARGERCPRRRAEKEMRGGRRMRGGGDEA
mmetsp:Transcript_6893/g.19118  ORF Transcript_6893/g.19118 Transcript_6893/m.19118 type:complete len:221 (+) Transcript_6893:697-1359(+)